MVYETVRTSRHPVFQVMAPRKPETLSNLHGRFFYATIGGIMRAYEYSTDPQPDLSHPQYSSFFSLFSNTLMELGADRLFALGVCSLGLENYTEVELQRYQATIFVENFEIPDSFDTDWTSPRKGWTADTIPVRQSRGGRGSLRKCGRRRLAHGRLSQSDREKHLCLDGKILPTDCKAHEALSSAIHYLAIRSTAKARALE